jgi:hypothetical protein
MGVRKLLAAMFVLAGFGAVFSRCAQGQYISEIERRNSTNEAPVIAAEPLSENVPNFVDRSYAYVQVPAEIVGAQYVRMANNDKRVDYFELDVTLAADAVLLLFIDNRVGNDDLTEHPADYAGITPNLSIEMAWAANMGFADTGIDIGVDESGNGVASYWSSVYWKAASMGTITLFELDKGDRNMYGVAAIDELQPVEEPPVWPLVFQADFEDESLDLWEATDPSAWRIEDGHGGKVLSLFKDSSYSPPFRSPYNINLVRNVVVDSFSLELEMLSTNSDYDHRDLCLFFGYQDASHFYYVHLGKTADAHANSIFVVDDTARISIAHYRTSGTPWDDNWHTARLLRDVETGRIEIYFDDSSTPVMAAVNHRFRWGRIGVGSFDDTGQFDDLELQGHLWVEADFVGPYGVDQADFAFFGSRWLETGCTLSNRCDGADLRGLDTVDAVDLMILSRNWLEIGD